MSIHAKNWNRKITARLISKNKVRVVLTCCRVHHAQDECREQRGHGDHRHGNQIPRVPGSLADSPLL